MGRPPLPNRLPWIEYWYLAFRADIGIKVTCTNFESMREQLYRARTESLDEDLMQLRVLKSLNNPGGELWIIHAHCIPDTYLPIPLKKAAANLDEDLDGI